ncbi:hypothetical protein F7725_013823 [Dissostichus mawsoni]|uniref:Uncharacterized protein n=1 Tax=Dissostichus mawsoni TaxID=36200 RepID=A0A7J5YUF8_DISMA|nr:hypothetical protein F7725_013823 [Dissostichus mawsoni]
MQPFPVQSLQDGVQLGQADRQAAVGVLHLLHQSFIHTAPPITLSLTPAAQTPCRKRGGQHLHQLVGNAALPHAVNQSLDVPEAVNRRKLQQSFPVALQSHLLERLVRDLLNLQTEQFFRSVFENVLQKSFRSSALVPQQCRVSSLTQPANTSLCAASVMSTPNFTAKKGRDCGHTEATRTRRFDTSHF